MSFVRNVVRYLAEDLTPIQWRWVAYSFAIMFAITIGAALFYSLFDQHTLISLWFGIVGAACIVLSIVLGASKKPAVATYTTMSIGLGSIFGSMAGVFIANLY